MIDDSDLLDPRQASSDGVLEKFYQSCDEFTLLNHGEFLGKKVDRILGILQSDTIMCFQANCHSSAMALFNFPILQFMKQCIAVSEVRYP